MIRRSPCELYIKFLLVHPNNYPTSYVKNALHSTGLDVPSEAYLAKLRQETPPPYPFRPLDIGHTASQRFIMAHRLKGFFAPDEDARLAHELLKKPRIKELIETLAMTNDPPAAIAHMVRDKGQPCSVRAIEYYLAFYWDLSLVDSTELRGLLHMRTEYLMHRSDGQEVPPHDWLQYNALKKGSHSDPRRLASELPVTPAAGLLNRMRMGYVPTNLDMALTTKGAWQAATLRVLNSLMDYGPNAAAQSRDFSVTAHTMKAVLDDLGSPDVQIQKDLQQLRMKTENTRPPHIQQLSDGHHTTDLQPTVLDAEIVDD